MTVLPSRYKIEYLGNDSGGLLGVFVLINGSLLEVAEFGREPLFTTLTDGLYKVKYTRSSWHQYFQVSEGSIKQWWGTGSDGLPVSSAAYASSKLSVTVIP